VLLLLALGAAWGGDPAFFLCTSKGLTVKVLQDNDLPFVTAQLLIYLDGNVQNYSSLAVAQLAVMNMFERELNSPPSNLFGHAGAAGERFPGRAKSRVREDQHEFSPDRLASFSKLLKEIFTYQSFHLNKFNESKARFWPLFIKGRDWKKEFACCSPTSSSSATFISRRASFSRRSSRHHMAQLRSFLLRTFRPDNALLILKGKINPYFVLGMIEKDLRSLRRGRPSQEGGGPAQRRPQGLHPDINSPDQPMVYWFDTAPPAGVAPICPMPSATIPYSAFPAAGSTNRKEPVRHGGYKVNSETVSSRTSPVLQLFALELQRCGEFPAPGRAGKETVRRPSH